MTFTAENNRIRVTDAVGAVVFDTEAPMPHIVGVIETTISHTFPESDDQVISTFGIIHNAPNCRVQEYICENVRTCGYVTKYVCNWINGQYVCGYEQVYGCWYDYVCAWQWVDHPAYWVAVRNRVLAQEHAQVYDLGGVAAGTSPDHILAMATCHRSQVGAQRDYGDFASAIPDGQMINANGTTILENAFAPGGVPWLSRIMSLYLDGDRVKAEFKHSNRAYDEVSQDYAEACNVYPSVSSTPANTSSTWTVKLQIYVGKFTNA